MLKSSSSVVVFTRRDLLEKKIKKHFSKNKTNSLFTDNPEKLIEYCTLAENSTLVITELTKEISIKSLASTAKKNKHLRVLFILPEYNPQLIKIIAAHENFDFVVDDAGFAAVMKQKTADWIKSNALNTSLALEKKRTKEYKNRYLYLFNNTIIGLYRTTPKGKVIMLNNTGLKLVGCKSLKDVRNVNLEDDYYDPYKLRSIFKQQLLEKGEIFGFENRWRRPDGKLMIVRENAKAVKDKKGNIIYYEGTFEDITSQVQTEKALDEIEKKLHVTLEAANIGIWNWDIKTNEIYFSREFPSMLGYTQGELPASTDTFVNLFHPDDKHIILTDLLANVTITRPDFEAEVRMIKKSGELRWVLTKGRVIEWNGNIPFNLIAVLIDITDRKISETKIIESESRFRELAENIEEIFWLLSDKEVLYISPGLEKIWGIPEAYRHNVLFALYRTLHKEDRERIKKAIKLEVLKGPGIFDEEFRIIRPDGIEKWIWARTFPVRKGNTITRSVGIAEDITPRKLLQLELERLKNDLQITVDIRTSELTHLNLKLVDEIKKQKKSEEEIENQLKFFRTLIETAMSPMFIKDADKKYIDCNRAFEEYFNESRERIIGKSDKEIFPPELAGRYESVDDQLLQNPGEMTYEDAVTDSSSTRKEYMITKSTFMKADGIPGGIIAFVTDITQKKKLDFNIQKAFEKEKELLEVKSKLISTASHEFRTPLTTILSSVDLIEIYRQKDNMERYSSHIEKIKSSVKYMIELLNDVMLINKTESGKLEYSPGITDLIELCGEIINEIKQTSGDQVRIVFNHDEQIKPVLADKKIIKLIIANLLSNAVKYSDKNGVVNLDLKLNNDIVFCIKDRGIGIPEEEYPMMYEPFHRGKNVSQFPGTGLGLSIVKSCIELHKGKISFTSRLNEGTTFNVIIPLTTD